MIEQVTDPDDASRLDDYRGSKGRPAKGTGGPVIVESLLGVEALASAGLTIRSVLVSPQKLHRLPPLPDGTTVWWPISTCSGPRSASSCTAAAVVSAERPGRPIPRPC